MVRSYGVPIFRVKTVVCVDVVCQFFCVSFYIFFITQTGVYRGIHYFSYFCSKTDCGYSLEPPRRGGSNE